MTVTPYDYQNRRPNRAERRAARSNKPTSKAGVIPRHAAPGDFHDGQAVSPFSGRRLMDAVARPDYADPTT